jgi:hypothetical protein
LPKTRRSEAEARADSDLKYWGFHVGKQWAADGYPTSNTLLNALSGRSDLNPLSPTFGVNIRDIPAEAWRINALVMKLRGEHREVLIARYALPVNYETGQPIKAEVIAQALDLHVRKYFRLLREARERFYRMAVVSMPIRQMVACSA